MYVSYKIVEGMKGICESELAYLPLDGVGVKGLVEDFVVPDITVPVASNNFHPSLLLKTTESKGVSGFVEFDPSSFQ